MSKPAQACRHDVAVTIQRALLHAASLGQVGDIVAASLVALHTDNLERLIRPRPAVHWPHVAALIAHDAEVASCGIKTVFGAVRMAWPWPNPPQPAAQRRPAKRPGSP